MARAVPQSQSVREEPSASESQSIREKPSVEKSQSVRGEVLQAPMLLEYPFTRSTGPVIGAFLTGLREKMVLGIRRADGSVLCPPLEYDPITSEPLTELVEVADVGEVMTWAWNGEPRPQHPFDGSFAWALIRLDGADTPMLHAVLVDSASKMATGMRVRLVWREERTGHIADIAGFEPVSMPE